MYELKTDAYFDSAHFLADYMGRCENIHGHRWRVEAAIGADALKAEGTERDMVCDFSVFKHAVRSIAKELDHAFLVEAGTLSQKTIKCLEDDGQAVKILPFRTTAENFAAYIYKRLAARGFDVTYIEVDETPNNRAVFAPAPDERAAIKAEVAAKIAEASDAPADTDQAQVESFFNPSSTAVAPGVNAATSVEANGLFNIKGRKRRRKGRQNKSAQETTFYIETAPKKGGGEGES